jgi:bifunctional oligoribonuclease and PAP phosphatase NrnA
VVVDARGDDAALRQRRPEVAEPAEVGDVQDEEEVGLSWLTVPAGAIERHETTADDLEGLAEMARSVQGTRLALLFRPLANGNIKVSFRSVGDLDVSSFARGFGGGGHAKASGASLVGTLDEVQRTVLGAARTLLREAAPG